MSRLKKHAQAQSNLDSDTMNAPATFQQREFLSAAAAQNIRPQTNI